MRQHVESLFVGEFYWQQPFSFRERVVIDREVSKRVDIDMVGGDFALFGNFHLLLDICSESTMTCHLTTDYLHTTVKILHRQCTLIGLLTNENWETWLI